MTSRFQPGALVRYTLRICRVSRIQYAVFVRYETWGNKEYALIRIDNRYELVDPAHLTALDA